MDGFQMMRKSHNSKAENLPAGISVMRPIDRFTLIVWAVSFLACMVALYATSVSEIWIFALPFVVAGFIYLLVRRNYIALVIIAVILVATYFLTSEDHQYVYLYIMAYICFGATGVASIVDAIQRLIFYRILRVIRTVNTNKKVPIRYKLVAFLFSVPHDLDTRNIMADLDVRSRRFPVRDLMTTIGLSMTVGMFFWIYISFNPSFVNLSDTSNFTLTDSSLMMFTVMLYVPVLVMPVSIFRSMNVRIGTNFRDFKLYNGAVSTIQRMAVPVAAALIFVILAVSTSRDLMAVLVFIGISAAMIMFVVSVTTVVYFYGMEATIVSSIARKWKIFMPVTLLGSLKEREPEADFPGTPTRDESDVSGVELRNKAPKGL